MKRLALILLFSSISVYISAQTFVENVSINWASPKEIKLSEYVQSKYLYFEDALLDENLIPYYLKRIPVQDNSSATANITNLKYVELDANDYQYINDKSLINSDFVIESNIATSRYKSYLYIEVIPLRFNQENNKIEKLLSFDINVFEEEKVQPKLSYKDKASTSSVLSTGNWYKLEVSKDGIYKISYSFLQNLGISMSSINPKSIRIYGNGGGMLSEVNSDFRHDDLAENAIYVRGENDGVFNSDDYILFYAKGPHEWDYDGSVFNHKHNIYSDYAYYFLSIDIPGNGKRIENQSSSLSSPNTTVTSFDDLQYHETNSSNLILSGREWYGENFDYDLTFSKSFSVPDIDKSQDCYLKVNAVARSSSSSSYSIYANNSYLDNISIGSVNVTDYTSTYAQQGYLTKFFKPSSSSISIKVEYKKSNSSSEGWLNYIELNSRRNLKYYGSQFIFRDKQSIGSSNVSEFKLSNANSSVNIWEVTDPVNVKNQQTTLDGSTKKFVIETDSLREFIAFNGSSYYTPTFIGKVANQNLHGITKTDMVIIVHPNFKSEANSLAKFHRAYDGFTVDVVTPAEIYNEFSSGAQDISAIRDFARMLYKRETGFKYLLLFGDGSYDFKDINGNNSNYVPSYQSVNSLHPPSSYVSDDYYALLDDNEGGWIGSDKVDIAIGRFPVKTIEESRVLVDKVIRYSNGNTNSTVDVNEIPSLGDWRNNICFIADDEDGNVHLGHSDDMADDLSSSVPELNINKIYFDAYTQISSAGGDRYPEVNRAINDQVESGALIVNYTGHGGEVGLSHERAVELSDIHSWSNKYNLPLFITATCEFSRYDDPDRTSAGEYVLLNNDGGGIGLITTTRIAYTTTNKIINDKIYKHAFKKIDGEFPRIGDIYRETMADVGSGKDYRNITLIGNPAVRLKYPEYNVVTKTINGNSVDISVDTLKALSKVVITGEVQDTSGSLLSSFNGYVYPTIFDKSKANSTLANDPDSYVISFLRQQDIIYKGKASVVNGEFSFTFIVPKDISYAYGNGKISYYAENGVKDGNGVFEDVIIGGSNPNIEIDEESPVVELYLDFEDFVSGGITDESPLLYANVFDSSGINTIGNGIGHDIVAILDNDTDKPIILNNYYEADLDKYTSGKIRYQFTNLSPGKHTLKLKVWDIYNNSKETSIEFYVAESSELQLMNVLNYPNPFSNYTEFYFEHNQPYESLSYKIEIYTISGNLIKTIQDDIVPETYRIGPIAWDAKDDFGDNLAKGVYIYKLKVKDSKGNIKHVIEKMFKL